MLQTISYVFYLALGARVFASIENWSFVDALYWADYTLLTIGLGSDFPLKTTAGKALLIPYAAGGIMMIGLVIGSVRGLVLERGKVKVLRRKVQVEREKWMQRIDTPDGEWKKREFEAMRDIQRKAEMTRKHSALGSSLFAFLVLWFLGAMVFWFSEVCSLSSRIFLTIELIVALSEKATTMDVLPISLLHVHHPPHHRLRRLLPPVLRRQTVLRRLVPDRHSHRNNLHLQSRGHRRPVAQGGHDVARATHHTSRAGET